MGSTSWNRPEIVKIIKTTESFKEFDCLLYKSIKNYTSEFQFVLFHHDTVPHITSIRDVSDTVQHVTTIQDVSDTVH